MKSEYKQYVLWGVMTLFVGACVCYLFNLAGFAGQADSLGFTWSALSVLCFVIVGCFLRMLYNEYQKIADLKVKKRRFVYSYVFSFLLALSFVLGYQMHMLGNTLPGIKGKAFILFVSVGLAFVFMPILNIWFAALERWQAGEPRQDLSARTKKRCFVVSWLVIFLCWVPVFLAYYPSIMSYDFHRQSQEAYKGYIWFNDHHPLAHTFLIRIFLLLGESLGSYQTGMALYSLLQMLILSVVMAYSCNVIARMTRRVWPVVVAVLFFGLLPIQPVLALSVTKDILFAAFLLLFVLLMWEQRRFFTQTYAGTKTDKLKMPGFFLAMLVTGILAILFRNNAVYAIGVFTVFYVIIAARQRLLVLLLCVGIVVGGLGCKTGIRVAMDAGTGNKIEMLSVFIQQFARVGNRQHESLTEEEKNIIAYYIPEEEWAYYNPTLADGMKSAAAVSNFEEWKHDIPGMLSDWVKIGVRYFNEYIDAFLALTAGYWFLDDVSHAEVLGYGGDTDLGLLYTFNASFSDDFEGVESHSYLPGLLAAYQEIVNGNSYYGWPVLSLLFKPAFYVWLLLLVMVSHLYTREKRKLSLSLLVLMYLLTLLLGPVVHMRYVYCVIVAVPVLLAYIFCKEEKV